MIPTSGPISFMDITRELCTNETDININTLALDSSKNTWQISNWFGFSKYYIGFVDEKSAGSPTVTYDCSIIYDEVSLGYYTLNLDISVYASQFNRTQKISYFIGAAETVVQDTLDNTTNYYNVDINLTGLEKLKFRYIIGPDTGVGGYNATTTISRAKITTVLANATTTVFDNEWSVSGSNA